MRTVEPQIVSIPLAGSYNGEKTTGCLYGSGGKAIIFSNMDTNDQNEWEPIVPNIASAENMVLTYRYAQYESDQSVILEDAIAHLKSLGARKIVLVGASRGGVASMKVAAKVPADDCLAGVVAISAPIEYEGVVFYSDAELRGIKIPKLLINSENDICADGTRRMYDIVADPKELLLFPGDAHGTELFPSHCAPLIERLKGFVDSL